MSEFDYVAECLRLSGQEAVVYTCAEDVECGGCGKTIRRGEEFTRGPYRADKPECFDCEPYSPQETLFGKMAPPTRGRRSPPSHQSITEYQSRSGQWYHSVECSNCRGRRGGFVKVKGADNNAQRWLSCENCGGQGRHWRRGRLGIEGEG